MLLDRFRRKSAGPTLPCGDVSQTLRALTVSLLLLPTLGPTVRAGTEAPEPLVAVARSPRLPQALRQAQPLGRLAASTEIKIALALPWRNSAALDTLLHRLYDPADPLYKKFLTHAQFIDRFAPAPSDYDALKSWAAANGLSVAETVPSRNLLILTGKRDAVEAGFHVQLNRYRLATGREVYVNDAAPKLPRSIAARVVSVVGLTDYAQKRPFHHVKPNLNASGIRPMVPYTAGTGAGGGLTPGDIRSIYDINPLYTAGLDGSGQTIALYEQNGYLTSDIAAYVAASSLPAPTLANITIGGYDGTVTDPDTQGEVTLDIELALAIAPKAKILVYELNNQDYGTTVNGVVIDGLTLEQKIANDNLANIVSESYGQAEDDAALSGLVDAENVVFTQMAAQGQSMLASSGDSAAYINEGTDTAPDYVVTTSDPASQPLVTAIGGTTLVTAPIVAGVATYGTESTWFDSPFPLPDGGGGGVSKVWTKPAYQTGQGASATMRDVPDVSLNGDPETGYSIYLSGAYTIFGGTSCSCPLWAAFLALVNQQRVIDSLPVMGFANPSIYTVAEGKNYSADFHDINDGSTNGVYTTNAGFDDCTGWGTFIAANLLSDFAPSAFGASPISVKVVDAGGNPVSGAAVTVISSQVSSLALTATTATDGTTAFTVPTGIHNYNSTGVDQTLSYTVSADLAGFAGASQADVTPSTAATVQLQILPTDHTYASSSLQMISSPYDYSTSGDFATLFGLTPPLGTAAAGALFAYSPTVNGYLTYPTAPADTLRLGQGYWAVLPSAKGYVRRKGVPAPTTQPYRIGLLAGWNMIGDPFTSAVPISSITVDTVTPGTPVAIGSAATVQLPLYSYNGTTYQALGTGDSIQPFQGYWVHATQPAELVIPVP